MIELPMAVRNAVEQVISLHSSWSEIPGGGGSGCTLSG